MSDVVVLQVVKLKGGLATESLVAAASGLGDATRTALESAAADGLITEKAGRYRISPAGREALDGLLAVERETVDGDRVEDSYAEFVPLNDAFKSIIGDWQLRDGAPNPHDDASYDAAVLGRLAELHGRMDSVVERAVAVAPRLAPYQSRFAAALGEVQSGDHRFVASPIVDSYHQIWFEFHEELIGLAGRERLQEAQEGRA